MPRPGIFDPWRQEAPPAKDLPEPPRGFDPDAPPPVETCIAFDGKAAGLNVWVQAQFDDPSRENLLARRKLIEGVHRLHAHEEARRSFVSWGISITAKPAENTVVLTDSDMRSVTITSPTSGEELVPRAIDVLALALREICSMRSNFADVLEALHVVPLLK